jgi:outer membrane assembly lipoprotein YfgL
VAVLGAALLAAACGSDRPKPTPLSAVTPTLGATLAWSLRLEGRPIALTPAVRGGTVTLAGGDGSVFALDAASGRELWRGSAGAPLSAGVGTDGRFAAVVTRDNELVVLDNGVVKWRTRLASRVTTAPLVAGERVFVMGVDRVVQAWDAVDGRYLWQLQRPGEALTLAQPGVLTAFNDTLLVGQGQRLTGVDPLRGTVRFEVALANPRGTNEVERVADLIGPAARSGDTVCARSFQSAVGCADARRGALLWSKTIGGLQAVGADGELVAGADGSDRITAWRSASGDLAWTNEILRYRELSGVLVVDRAVVVGDLEGQVHFLDRASGHPIARVATNGSAVVGTPVMAGTTIVVTTRNGGVFAFRLG